MFSEEEIELIILALEESGNSEALEIFKEKTKNEEMQEFSDYDLYFMSGAAHCHVCKKCLTYEDFNFCKVVTRNLDCAATDYTIGCCICSDDSECHKLEYAQFICKEKCYQEYKEKKKIIVDKLSKLEKRAYNVSMKSMNNKDYIKTDEDNQILKDFNQARNELKMLDERF